MTISKLPFFLCALAIGAICLTVRAEDNPAQAAARLALAKQLFETSAPPATNAPAAQKANAEDAKAKAKAEKAAAKAADEQAAAARAAATAQAKEAKTAAANATPPAAQPVATARVRQAWDKPADTSEDNPAQAAARIALAKQLFEASSSPATNAPASKMVSRQDNQAKAMAEQAAAAKAKADQAAAARAAAEAKARKQNAEKQASAAPASPTAPAPKPASPAANAYEGADLGLKPIPAPALPISASKAERLAALLVKYKADQISPEEYHQQRAAILAEP